MNEWAKRWMQTMTTCPIEDYNCPYCDANGICMMDTPERECDDYMAVYEYIDPGGE